jgi:hypothetical protein
MTRIGKIALAAGVVAIGLCAGLGFANPAQFFRSYLVAYLLWSGVAFGSLAALMIHHLAGGGWGYLIRRSLEAATRTWPLVALLFLPLLAGIPYLYVWSRADAVAASKVLQQKHLYLNVPFFIARAAFYFAVLGILIHLLNKWSRRQDSSGDPALLKRLQNLSGPGLVIYALIASFALVDWAMSLEPDWFSTIFPAIWMMGQILSGLALSAAFLVLLARLAPLSRLAVPKYFNDVGNMMLAFVILWAYMQFGQLLIIWSGNLTDEIPWYLHRVVGGWTTLTVCVVVFHFVLPFALLLSHKWKRDVRVLSRIAVAVVAFRLLDAVWTVEPTFDTTGFRFHLMDLLLPVALGGIWVAAFVRQLRNRPLLPLEDPRLPLVLERIEHLRVGDVVYGKPAATA